MYCCTSSASLNYSLQALPEERLEAAYENGFVDYRALLCQTRRAVPCERRTLTATIVHWAGSAVVTTM